MLNDIYEEIEIMCHHILEGIEPLLHTQEDIAYFIDPVLGLNRNRVNAEIYKSLARLEKTDVKSFMGNIKNKIINWLLTTQNKDGSWNEIHSNYNQPSALLTSFVGEALLLSDETGDIQDALEKAKEYVLSNELFPGYFKKSGYNYADCLNVNATCGAFLAQYASRYGDSRCFQAANRAAHHVCYYQFSNGAFPYTTEIRGYPYQYHYYVPCIHYQGVTLFFLSKIHKVLKDEWMQHALEKGGEWLASVQKKDGYFKWSKSGLMYAYYLSGAYAFTASTFIYTSQWHDEFLENAKLSLSVLNKNINGIVNRWEQAPMWTLPKGFIDALRSARLGNYPLKHRFFRLGYAVYKQYARRRYSKELDDKLFRKLSSSLNIESTWIEPSKNYPDLFNTSEVLDCLTTTLVFLCEREENAL